MRNTKLEAPFFIAWRYLFSKKRHQAVNIISLISTLGIAVSAAALIIVLSVFNGIEALITVSFNSFNPDLEITPARGKTIAMDSFPFRQLEAVENVTSVHAIVSDLTLVAYKQQQVLARLKGVDQHYVDARGLDRLLLDGSFQLRSGGGHFGICGAGVDALLQIQRNEVEPLKIYYPKRTKKSFANAADAFYERRLIPHGTFATFTRYDDEYIFCDLSFARSLMEYEGFCTSVELFVDQEERLGKTRDKIQQLLGEDFLVRDKYQQEELIFKTMKSEKLMIFLILAFILVIAAFNIISTMGMLIIEKKADLGVFATMGASQRFISRIFTLEGLCISFLGGLLGMLTGMFLCFLQDQFHLIAYGSGEGHYIIDHYPVDLQGGDFLLVFASTLVISVLASYFPVKIIQKKYPGS